MYRRWERQPGKSRYHVKTDGKRPDEGAAEAPEATGRKTRRHWHVEKHLLERMNLRDLDDYLLDLER